MTENRYDQCALACVQVRLASGELKPVSALGVVGDWSVTLDEPSKRYVVTHVPTGLKTGPTMTERDALRTCARALVCVRTNAELIANRLAIYNAHPTHLRKTWKPSWIEVTFEVHAQIDRHLIPEECAP